MFLQEGGIRAFLKLLYTGFYKFIKRKKKNFKIKVRGQLITVTINRVKPFYQWADQ